MSITRLPTRPRVPAFPQQYCPATHSRVAKTLEAADEAELAGLLDLRDRLVDAARAEVQALRERLGLAA